MSKVSRSRKWVFTLHDYTDEDEQKLKEWKHKYLLFGREVAPTTGQPHLQGFMVFRNAVAFTTWKKRFPTIHVEPARGGTADNQKYCKKDGDFYEDGEAPEEGREKGSRAQEQREAVRNASTTRTLRQFLHDDTVPSLGDVKLFRTFQEYKPVKRNKPTVHWYYGPSGTGKTMRAATECADHDAYWVPPDAKWWPGYDGHTHVVIDELRGNFQLSTLLRLLDRYPLQVEFKGGYVHFCPEHIYITTPYSPISYMNKYHPSEERMQLLRRIDEAIDFSLENDRPDYYENE